MIIFQRYILRELAGPVLMSILFFTFIMLLRQLFDMAELLLEAGIGAPLFFELLGIIAVSLIFLTIPMAVLLGVLIGIGRLTSENEILAMRVSGTSLFRVFYPLVIAGFIGSAGLMYSGFYLVPNLVENLLQRQTQIEFELLTKLEPGRNYDEFSPPGTDLYLYFDQRGEPQPGDSPYTLRMRNVAMRVVGELGEVEGTTEEKEDLPSELRNYRDQGEQETLFFAEEGTIMGDLKTMELTIELHNGTIIPLNRMMYQVDRDADLKTALYRETPERHITLSFESMTKTIFPKSLEERDDEIQPSRYTIAALHDYTESEPEIPFWRDEKRGRVNGEWKKYTAAKNEIYQRYSLPFALPAFILIAIPLAVELRPRAKSVSFLIAMGLILVYYVMITWAGTLGARNHPLTPFAFMLPNFLIGGIGLLLFWRVERQ